MNMIDVLHTFAEEFPVPIVLVAFAGRHGGQQFVPCGLQVASWKYDFYFSEHLEAFQELACAVALNKVASQAWVLATTREPFQREEETSQLLSR